jgi:MFS family permease
LFNNDLMMMVIGMLGPALCFAYCAFTPDLSVSRAAEVIAVGSAMSALTVGAVSCNHFDISKFNAGTIFGIGNTAACIGGLVAVPISGYIFDSTHSWNNVFLLFAIHYVVGTMVYNSLAGDAYIDSDEIDANSASLNR